MRHIERFLQDAAATEAFGEQLAGCLDRAALIYLSGDLGAGKTTLVRGVLRGLGFQGRVKSPTYTLVEPYTAGERRLYHLDLYRLADPEELEWIGIRDLLDSEATLLVEWPQQGVGCLPSADLEVQLTVDGDGRRVQLSAAPGSATGQDIVRCLATT